MSTPLYRIDADHSRFRDIVRGRIRRDLRRFLASGELIGRCGEKAVSIPLPQIELPRFRFGDNDGGEGQGSGEGESQPGQPADGEGGGGQAGDGEGQHILEVEVDLDDLAEMLGEELELPNIQPRGRREIEADGARYTGVRTAGPDSLRHFRRSYKRALLREVASGTWDADQPIIVPVREDFRFRARKLSKQPDSSAVVFHMMDVSGSMGREQKEIVRIQAFWIDAWLRKQYRNLEVVYIVHDAAARQVDQHTFFHLRESGGTKISSAYDLCLKQILDRYRPEDWNIYPFHYSDGDNWSARDTDLCVSLLRDEVLPRANQFCYSQVKSAHGSGQFKKDLDSHFEDVPELVTVSLEDRSGIPESIRAFLGAGR
ncbi:DUF444 family protein [Engelhardtia mirabilis]|uniref:DUF444 family protein n=1 Tax=Engelhardtia mirabilis TaxID=2528011 RepID=A0A518BJB8_9BACT|nr:hypothetical protein Pla133_21480 [Planctomycetes bacterium Pla133]QDV01397.1 hypothetical protein Pla86_21480 [Planctomycetes bacterium Pla86]